MKKLITLLFLGILIIACSNDDKVTNINPESGKLVFEISTDKRQAGPRAGEPVYSQAATNKISRITILAFQKDTDGNYSYAKSFEVSDWVTGAANGRFEVPEADNLPDGTYGFLAIGRSQTDLYQILPNLTSTTTPQQVYASITNSGDEYEVFAGQVLDQVVTAGGGRVALTLSRSVGGILGYFQNVPQILNGRVVRYLRLTVSAGNKHLFLFNSTGNSAAPSYDLINIDLSLQEAANEVYQGNNLSETSITKLPNSQLDGAYVIPIGEVSLTLGLFDDNNDAIRTWPVRIGTEEVFSIQPNHFYSLGRKLNPSTITGDDPDDAADDDLAIDLLKNQVVFLEIDPAWNTIHQLTIE